MEEYRPTTEKRRIGLLGGTFDPIHYGHLLIAEEVSAVLDMAEMIFIPAGQPPHKPGRVITPAEHRLAMLELAIASNPRFTISLVEMKRPGLSYLVDTLHILRSQVGTDVELSFVIGWDSLEELHTWYKPQGILEQLDALVAVGRPGYVDEGEYNNKQLEARLPGITQRLRVVQTPQFSVSSTDLRRRVAQGRPIKYQVPEAVERYIFEHGLYVSDNKEL
ncbi:MAG: nicotinate-nucleotide adenylyltransferase [Ktedonobacteraceae bacterium]|nr:nicotinate-nucleotide adenylyltransferase [Ktedonobacteraceae bacterium]